MTKIEAVKHDRIRKLILDALAKQYPNVLDTVVLRRYLATFGYPMTHGDLSAYIAYLKEKELVKEDRRPGDIVMVSITSRGIDVLDERIMIEGVGQDLD